MNEIEGIIYKTQDYRETSRLLYVYTNKGKVTLLASGAQKVKSNTRILSQYLTHISFKYKIFKDFLRLNNGVIINSFQNIKKEYNLVKDASLILELVDKAVSLNDNHKEIFKLVIKALNYKNLELSSLSFALKLLYILGYGMDLKSDGRKIKGFNIKLGRIVYIDENYKIDLNEVETLTLLKLTYYEINDLHKGDYTKENIKTIKSFINLYYAYHINIKIKSLKN